MPDGSVVLVTAVGLVRADRLGCVHVIADVGVGANGAAVTAAGDFVVAHNGGVGRPDQKPGRILRVSSDGTVSTLVDDLATPNDITVAPDGSIIFTDPRENWFGEARLPGRVYRLSAGGALETLMTGLAYPNGVGLHSDGSVVVAESRTGWLWKAGLGRPLKRWARVGSGAPDGFAAHPDGRLFVCVFDECRIDVLDSSGRLTKSWATGSDTWPTNCCVSIDERHLYWTDSLGGRLLRVDL